MMPNRKVRGRSGAPAGRAARAREALSPAGEGQGPLAQRVLAAAQAVGSFIEGWGFRAIDGRVWTLLALSREPLSQSQLARALGVSRSLVNLAVTELTGFGLVRATGESRNAPYEARLDVWPAIGNVLRSREWMLVESARVALEAAVQEAELSGQGPYDLARMRLLLSMSEFAQLVLRSVLSIRVPHSVESFERWLSQARAFLKRFRIIRAA